MLGIDISGQNKYHDEAIASIISSYIEMEIASYSYKTEKTRKERIHFLTKIYWNIFRDSTIECFTYDKIDELLQHLTDKELRFVCRLIIFAIEEGQISDKRLQRLVPFKGRIAFHFNYREFKYLISSEIYDDFIEGIVRGGFDPSQSACLFFQNCNDICFKDAEIKELTTTWIEKEKLNNLCVEARARRIVEVRRFSKAHFENHDLSELSRYDLVCTDAIEVILEYLNFIDLYHNLSSDIQYIISLREVLKGCSVKKYHELCLCENVFQYIAIEGVSCRRIYLTDIPADTVLFSDMVDFLKQTAYADKAFGVFIQQFYTSMGDCSVDDTSELSFDSFIESNRFFDRTYHNKKYASFIFSFYNFCFSKYQINFFKDSGLNIAVLSRRGILTLVNNGYSFVKYNPYDPVPVADKWILCYQKEYEATTEHSTSNTVSVDFSDIKNETFRYWLKVYVWKAQRAIKSKLKVRVVIKKALNYIHSIRTGETLVVYCRHSAPLDSPITPEEAVAFKQHARIENVSPVTQSHVVNTFRTFLQFLDDHNICVVSSSIYYHLAHHQELNNSAHAIPNQDLDKLIKVISEKASESIKNELYAIILKIALDTELRISEILSLEADCVYETAKKGEFIILTRRKDASVEYAQVPIPSEVKYQIDRALMITSSLRRDAPDFLQNTLFIVSQKGTVPVRKLTRENFRRYMIACCKQAGIPKYTAANLRDTHMTKARELKIKKHLSELEISVLTGHKTPNVDMVHYVDMDISTMMEAMHGIIIGNVRINGSIERTLHSEIANVANEVADGCGYCKLTACNDYTYLDCLVCKNFATMPSKLPFFRERVEQLNIKIQNTKDLHEKEDLINIKRLHVAYMVRILDKLEED